MLNENIRVDLHIHSKISEYKEDSSIVKDSTKENLPILLDKLVDHKISMFAFSDHNRFDKELFLEAKRIIGINSKYSQIKCILPSIEFDVRLEENKKPCHIITVFNCKVEQNLNAIVSSIDELKLINKSDFYTTEKFEDLLKKIGLDTILIACQRKALIGSSGGASSFSDSVEDPYEYLSVGYIDALEYQKPHVEGILLNNLKDFPRNVGLIAGSDCHQWNYYPFHDEHDTNVGKAYFSSIKALPSFMGLLLALTSPKSRFKRSDRQTSQYIKSISLNGITCDLSPGINAIIGENGSGKSSIIYGILDETSKGKSKYAAAILKENKFIVGDKVEVDRIKAVRQSEILENSNKSASIFGNEEDYFVEIDNADFEERINLYAENLLSIVENRISLKTAMLKLGNSNFEFKTDRGGTETFYISFFCNDDFTIEVNPHEVRLKNMNQVIKLLKKELVSKYYSETENLQISNALAILVELRAHIVVQHRETTTKQKIKNIIKSKLQTYNECVKNKSSTLDAEKMAYTKSMNSFIDSIVDVVRKQKNITSSNIQFPKSFVGLTDNPRNGYIFRKIAQYHDTNLEQDFFRSVFRKDYASLSEIMKVDQRETLAIYVLGANITNYKACYKDLTKKFIAKFEETSTYILEAESKNKMGSTLGEMSLIYYKFHTYQESDWDILVIDQPEDNISNSKINEYLIEYIHKLRDEKQVIFVTHNPLLVVNLDVDNVVYLEKLDGKISAVSGCLEDEENKIIDIVAENMDGGRETLERRLRSYGKKGA